MSTQAQFDDMHMITDALSTQKLLASNYNTSAGECSTCNMMDDLLGIASDNHKMQFDLFKSMETRGWYETQPAQKQMITEAKEKFQNFRG
jgi:Coat F domain.